MAQFDKVGLMESIPNVNEPPRRLGSPSTIRVACCVLIHTLIEPKSEVLEAGVREKVMREPDSDVTGECAELCRI
jgi:hypothetical protein